MEHATPYPPTPAYTRYGKSENKKNQIIKRCTSPPEGLALSG
jgi:hypothetical protein